MADPEASSALKPGRTVICIDALGGEGGPGAIIGGMDYAARDCKDVAYILHGETSVLAPLAARRKSLEGRIDFRDVSKVVLMDEKPTRALRSGKDSSMWNALESVRDGEAGVAVSCGNTGALMAMATLRLRTAPGVNRPAIAVLWPSRNPHGHNVVLDVGADIRADADDLHKFALMGAEYAREGLGLAVPRIGLLNVGTEDHKGRPELHEGATLIADSAGPSNISFIGFVEGADIFSDKVDVVVTDGFTGNIALKTAEGTASLTRDLLRQAFSHSPFSQLGALFAMTSLRRLRERMDPRRVNGGVFLGLNGTIVKSHGGADATGVSAAIKLAYQLAQRNFNDGIRARIDSDVRQVAGGDAPPDLAGGGSAP